MRTIIYIFLIIGFFLNCIQCLNSIKRYKRNYGSSGVPVIVWFLFYFFPLFLTEQLFYKITIFTNYVSLDMFILFLIDITFYPIILIIYKKLNPKYKEQNDAKYKAKSKEIE